TPKRRANSMTAAGLLQRSTPLPSNSTGDSAEQMASNNLVTALDGTYHRLFKSFRRSGIQQGRGPTSQSDRSRGVRSTAGARPAAQRGGHRPVQAPPELAGLGDSCLVLGNGGPQPGGVHRATDTGRILKGASAFEPGGRLADNGQQWYRLGERLGNAHGQVHHSATGRATADPQGVMHPSPAVGHEGCAHFGLGAYGAEALAAQTMHGVV